MLNYIIICAGVLLLIDAVYMLFISNMNAGIWALALFSVVLIVYGAIFDFLESFVWLHVVVAVGLFLLFAFGICLAVCGKRDTAKYDEDAAIVLGSGIRGERVSRNLAKRLDKAIEYHAKNPDAFIIVSGGCGKQEIITEALAMQRYLLSKGMPSDMIIKEEKSTTTEENFLFSLEIAREKGLDTSKMLYITSAFHIYRAGIMAKKSGMSMRHLGADIVWYTLPMSYVREIMATVRTWMSGNPRGK